MPAHRRSIAQLALTALAGAALAACQPGTQPPATPAAPAVDAVATLNGSPVARTLLEQLAQNQAGRRNPYDLQAAGAIAAASSPVDRKQLLDELIDIELLAQKARERGLDKTPALIAQSALQAKTLLAQQVVREQIAGITVSAEELQVAYDDQIPPHEFQLRHILLADRDSADAVVGQLRQGQAFAQVAKRHGGSEGWAMLGQLPPPIAAAIKPLKPGAHTPQPVYSEEGWHLLQLVALRPVAERPSLEAASVWLHPQIVHRKVQVQQDQWRQQASIQRSAQP